MTPKSDAHLSRLLKDTRLLLKRKYTKGHEEHGGDLLDIGIPQLLNETIAEALDQLVYLLTLKEKLGMK